MPVASSRRLMAALRTMPLSDTATSPTASNSSANKAPTVIAVHFNQRRRGLGAGASFNRGGVDPAGFISNSFRVTVRDAAPSSWFHPRIGGSNRHILRAHFEAFVLVLPDDRRVMVEKLRRKLRAGDGEELLDLLGGILERAIVTLCGFALAVVPVRHLVDRR